MSEQHRPAYAHVARGARLRRDLRARPAGRLWALRAVLGSVAFLSVGSASCTGHYVQLSFKTAAKRTEGKSMD